MTEEQLQLRLEIQENPVIDEVSAITAVVRPVLAGILYSLKQQVVNQAGGVLQVPLYMLPRLHRPGDGDIGICFEYAVHDAIREKNPLIQERVHDALKKCKVGGAAVQSILFGAEKSGALNLIQTASDILTPDSQLLYGAKGRPVKLKFHMSRIATAFRQRAERDALPNSISGLWKADLFTGCTDTDYWVGTTLKINKTQLEGAKGLRLGIIPAAEGESDAISYDNRKNLVICPLPYDRSFMQVFYQAWEVVIQFLAADAKVPTEARLPRPPSRQVARYLFDRRNFPVVDVIDALGPLSQPDLLRTEEQKVKIVKTRETDSETTSALFAPIPIQTK